MSFDLSIIRKQTDTSSTSLPLIESKVSRRHQFHIARQVTIVCDGGFRSNRFWAGQIRLTKKRQEKNWSATRAFRSISYFSKKTLSVTNTSHFPNELKTFSAINQDGFFILSDVSHILVSRKFFLQNILTFLSRLCHIESYSVGFKVSKTWTESSSSYKRDPWGLSG